MTVIWHNKSANCLPPRDRPMLDKDALIALMQKQVDDIAKLIRTNPEPVYGGMRVRLLLERIDP